MNLHFRQMGPNDIEEVYKIEHDLFEDPWTKKSFKNELKQENISFPFIVEKDGLLLGYIICWYYICELHIGNIAVRRNFQRRGIGKFMLNKVFEIFPDFDIAFLEVRNNNKSAIQLYRSFGFKATHRRKSYYPNGEDAIVMAKFKSQNQLIQDQ